MKTVYIGVSLVCVALVLVWTQLPIAAQESPQRDAGCRCVWEGGVTYTLKAVHVAESVVALKVHMVWAPCCQEKRSEERLYAVDRLGQVNVIKALPEGAKPFAIGEGRDDVRVPFGENVLRIKRTAVESVNGHRIKIGSMEGGFGVVLAIQFRAPTSPKPVPHERYGEKRPDGVGGLGATRFCALKAGAWEACDGKRVRIKGVVPTSVSAHPVLTAPSWDGIREYQSYMDVEGGPQVIVVTRGKAVPCKGAMTATGKLHSVEVGTAGRGRHYKGWSLKDARVECR